MNRSGLWIGGSDWAGILSERMTDGYGCRRQTWYEKRGQEPDFPKEVSRAMERGIALENVIIDMASAVMNKEWDALAWDEIVPTPRIEDLPEWWNGSPDAAIFDNDIAGLGPDAILECKTAGRWPFSQIKRNGLPESYIMQLQHYLRLTGLKRGVYAVLWPDGWELITFEVERDDKMLALLEREGELFLRQVENGPEPDRLPATDKRCARCPFRVTCHGSDLGTMADELTDANDNREFKQMDDAELSAMCGQYNEMKAVRDDAAASMGDVRSQILERMKWIGHDSIRVPNAEVVRIVTERNGLDTKRLKAEMPDVAAKYAKVSKSEQLRVKVIESAGPKPARDLW